MTTALKMNPRGTRNEHLVVFYTSVSGHLKTAFSTAQPPPPVISAPCMPLLLSTFAPPNLCITNTLPSRSYSSSTTEVASSVLGRTAPREMTYTNFRERVNSCIINTLLSGSYSSSTTEVASSVLGRTAPCEVTLYQFSRSHAGVLRCLRPRGLSRS